MKMYIKPETFVVIPMESICGNVGAFSEEATNPLAPRNPNAGDFDDTNDLESQPFNPRTSIWDIE